MKPPILSTFQSITLGLSFLVSQPADAQQLFKCKDERGQITFSDTGCKLSPKERAQRRVPTLESLTEKAKGTVEKLTQANVEELVRKANSTLARGDHSAQCAMLAPDFLFNLTDRSNNVPTVVSGGKQRMCSYSQKTADMLRASGVSAASKLEKMTVKVDDGGKLANVNYTTLQTLSARGMPTLTIRCVQEDRVGIYDGHILFNHSSSTCDPVSLE